MPRSDAGTDDDSAALDAAGQALIRRGRLFGRQPIVDLLAARNGRPVELSRVLVVQVVADASSPANGDASQDEVTVGVVAARLGIDPSTASRLVAETVREGYLTRSASSIDARRTCLTLTEAGRALDASSRRFQRAVFELATDDWSAQDRLAFARLFVRFARAIAEHPALDTASTPIGEAERA
jgi:DNA-binding MarR family transcriptional regulator